MNDMPTDKDELIEYLKKNIELLETRNSEQSETIKVLQSTISDLNQTIVNLNETIDDLKRRLFGTSSEKTKKKRITKK